ncbi:hypothetical protein M8044_000543, partial [Columbia Basin potato purple top phytoplasma]|nr:hypothetical protein [Columbia Basin potato purple top phytoplasma]
QNIWNVNKRKNQRPTMFVLGVISNNNSIFSFMP